MPAAARPKPFAISSTSSFTNLSLAPVPLPPKLPRLKGRKRKWSRATKRKLDNLKYLNRLRPTGLEPILPAKHGQLIQLEAHLGPLLESRREHKDYLEQTGQPFCRVCWAQLQPATQAQRHLRGVNWQPSSCPSRSGLLSLCQRILAARYRREQRTRDKAAGRCIMCHNNRATTQDKSHCWYCREKKIASDKAKRATPEGEQQLRKKTQRRARIRTFNDRKFRAAAARDAKKIANKIANEAFKTAYNDALKSYRANGFPAPEPEPEPEFELV